MLRVYDVHQTGLEVRGIVLERETVWSADCQCYCGMAAYKQVQCPCHCGTCGHVQLRSAEFTDVDDTKMFVEEYESHDGQIDIRVYPAHRRSFKSVMDLVAV